MWEVILAVLGALATICIAIAGSIKAVNSISTKFSLQMITSMQVRDSEHAKLLDGVLDNMKEQTSVTKAMKDAVEANTNLIIKSTIARDERDRSIFENLREIKGLATKAAYGRKEG